MAPQNISAGPRRSAVAYREGGGASLGLTRVADLAHVPLHERVTLEFLGKQLERVIAEQNSIRDDLRVLTTIVLRLEGTLNGVLNQLHVTAPL
jgi:hypothetical protein